MENENIQSEHDNKQVKESLLTKKDNDQKAKSAKWENQEQTSEKKSSDPSEKKINTNDFDELNYKENSFDEYQTESAPPEDRI